ncbi:hypothetical protein Acid345_1892 [Candidatus Koribacter versatilis Ellin345]|uniref:Uncharacterized protein n=1 Tax=Koribacter versatilis (strain Ellin345) TaxID=204669 RepID=Q1IQF7_KORVE|nr:hypothetical protein [Candidatus Koribacter versatilis]ABF40893.1 hypothetical protein Acid345_1892 [Candidatus Koribacter versatilis Ellin345]
MVKRNLIRAAIVASLLFLFVSVSFAATTKTYIEKMSGWASCSVCAGAGGAGATIPHSMTQGITSPTLGSRSAQFSVGGSSSYGAALWWKQLGASSTAHNFQYDVDYYLKNPSASQALEFDVNQSVGGKKFVFGTQCNIAAHTYDVWSAATHWIHTGISCARPAAYKWNHITLEFQRTSGNNVKFVSVTINGSKHYINRIYAPKASSVSELNVAFQMDGNKSMTDYNAWLENVTLKYW